MNCLDCNTNNIIENENGVMTCFDCDEVIE
jgi:Zn-finger protein